jgi:hypothetical protein
MAGRRNQHSLQGLAQGTYASQGETKIWEYYDAFQVVVANTVNNLFTSVQGSTGKTLDVTNMTVAGQIPTGQRLTVTHIKSFVNVGYTAVLGTAGVRLLYNMLQQTTVEVKVNNKTPLLQTTLQSLLGANTLLALTPSAAGDNIPLIQPTFKGVFPLNIPIVLAATTAFQVTCTHQTAPDAALATAGTQVRIHLFGILEQLSE